MTNIFFKSDAHKARFLGAMQRLIKVTDGILDPEYASCLYILSADSSTWNKAQDYVSHDGIDIETLLKEVDFSGAYSVLILLAGNLFNGNEHVDPVEFMRLDDGNFKVALSAIMLRRGGLRLVAFQ